MAVAQRLVPTRVTVLTRHRFVGMGVVAIVVRVRMQAAQSRRPPTSSCGRACVKTPPLRNFGGRLTLGEVEKIAPSAIWRLDISSHSTRSAFSHSLGRE